MAAPADIFSKTTQEHRRDSLNRVKPEYLSLGMRKMDAMGPGTVECKGTTMLILAANNYLGLAGDRRLSEAASAAIHKWGNSTSGSRILNGPNKLHIALERALAEVKGIESVLVFQSGYMANLGVLSALLSPGHRHRGQACACQHHRRLHAGGCHTAHIQASGP